MSIVPNHALRRLREGKLAVGMGVRLARTVEVAAMLKTAGFDWMFIDAEHSSIDPGMAAELAAAALPAGISPFVRVAGMEHWHASRMLDNGAQGIVFPHIDDREQAALAASICRYPPAGKRSMGGALPQLGFAPLPVNEAARLANEETMVVAMIESPQGVANAEAIASVPGIDALLIGTNDFCFECGIPGQFEHPKVVDAYKTVIAACKKHGKFPGMGGMYTAELLEKHIDLGVKLILSGNDFQTLMQGATAKAKLVRGFER